MFGEQVLFAGMHGWLDFVSDCPAFHLTQFDPNDFRGRAEFRVSYSGGSSSWGPHELRGNITVVESGESGEDSENKSGNDESRSKSGGYWLRPGYVLFIDG